MFDRFDSTYIASVWLLAVIVSILGAAFVVSVIIQNVRSARRMKGALTHLIPIDLKIITNRVTLSWATIFFVIATEISSIARAISIFQLPHHPPLLNGLVADSIKLLSLIMLWVFWVRAYVLRNKRNKGKF